MPPNLPRKTPKMATFRWGLRTRFRETPRRTRRVSKNAFSPVTTKHFAVLFYIIGFKKYNGLIMYMLNNFHLMIVKILCKIKD